MKRNNHYDQFVLQLDSKFPYPWDHQNYSFGKRLLLTPIFNFNLESIAMQKMFFKCDTYTHLAPACSQNLLSGDSEIYNFGSSALHDYPISFFSDRGAVVEKISRNWLIFGNICSIPVTLGCRIPENALSQRCVIPHLKNGRAFIKDINVPLLIYD